MGPCERFADRWLDHLYGLLSEGESRELADHLSLCPSCQGSLTEAQREQRRLARASRWIRNVPEFQSPHEDRHDNTPPQLPAIAASADVPATLSFPKSSAPTRHSLARRLWPAWAAAAAVLVAALAGSELYRRGAADREQAVVAARKQVEDLQGKFSALKTEADAGQGALLNQAKAETLRLFVVGATKTQVDAPYTCRIATRDLNGKPLRADLEVRLVRADTGDVLHRQALATTGQVDVTLPAGLKLDKSVRLEVAAKSGTSEAIIRESLSVTPATHLVHLATSKVVAQHGEVIFFRALALERFSLKPATTSLPLRFELVDGTGKSVAALDAKTGSGGMAGGEFAIQSALPAGDYTIKVASADPKAEIQAQSRGLEVVERLTDFDIRPDRKFYRPGDKVVMKVNARGTDGQPIKNQLLVARPGVGKIMSGVGATSGVRSFTDAAGNAVVQFTLPAKIDGSRVNIQFEMPGAKKDAPPIIRSIAVAPSRLEADFYPEGGDLVAGLAQRIFYRVRTPSGDDAVPDGKVTLHAQNQGKVYELEPKQSLGSFVMVPDANEVYTLRIPLGGEIIEVKDPFQRLGIKAGGIVIEVTNGVAKAGEPIQLQLRRQGADAKLLIVASCRGQVVGQQLVEASAAKLALTLPEGVHGVVRLTAYEVREQRLTPLAERLVYRAPAGRLDLKTTTKGIEPGKTAQINIDARDEQGRPATAWALALAVEDQYRAERGENSLTSHFLVASEFGADLAEASLAIPDDPADLDLVLGTRGWRRFVAQAGEPAQFAKVAPALFSVENLNQEQAQAQLVAKVGPRLQELQQQVNRDRGQLLDQQQDAQASLAAAQSARGAYERMPAEYFRLGLGFLTVAALVAGILLLVMGLVRIARRTSSTMPFAGAFAGMGLCLALYLAGGALAPIDDGGAGENRVAAQKPFPPIGLTVVKDLGVKPAAPWMGTVALATPAAGASEPGMARSPSSLTGALALLEPGEMPTMALGAGFVNHPQMRQRFEAASNPPKEGFGREFAYRNQSGFDAQPILLWHPNLKLEQGQASVAFDVPNAPATYRLLILGHDATGRFGIHVDRVTAKSSK